MGNRGQATAQLPRAVVLSLEREYAETAVTGNHKNQNTTGNNNTIQQKAKIDTVNTGQEQAEQKT